MKKNIIIITIAIIAIAIISLSLIKNPEVVKEEIALGAVNDDIFTAEDIADAKKLILKQKQTDEVLDMVLANPNASVHLEDLISETVSYEDVLNGYQMILEMNGDMKTSVNYEPNLNEKVKTAVKIKLDKYKATK